MRAMTKAAIAVFIIILAGCASYQQAQLQKEGEAEFARIKSECSAMYSSPDLATLSQKIPLQDARIVTLEQINDTAPLADDERAALSRYDAVRRSCAQRGTNAVMKYLGPEAAAAFSEASARSDALVADLYGQKITIGQFNAARKQNADALQATFYRLQADQQQRQAQAQQARELQQIQAGAILGAAQAMKPTPQAQLPLPVPAPPANSTPLQQKTTRCQNVFGTLNCTTTNY